MKHSKRRSFGLSRFFRRKGCDNEDRDSSRSLSALENENRDLTSESAGSETAFPSDHPESGSLGLTSSTAHHGMITEQLKPMVTRLEALQIQQELQGMDHPDVIFALRGLSKAHLRRGEFREAQLVEEMIVASQNNQRIAWNAPHHA